MKEIVLGKRQKRKVKMFDRSKMNEIVEATETTNGRLELIRALIPLGLKAVHDELGAELERLTGTKHRHDEKLNRWGRQPGSVYLGEEKFRIEVPRVRDLRKNTEIPLETYAALQKPGSVDERVMKKILLGLSARRYEETARNVPEAFGLSASSVSRKTVRASARKLRELSERRLEGEDFVAIFIDGKNFSDDGIVLAVGITVEGEKRILGIIETATENGKVVSEFFNQLLDRGLTFSNGLLFVVDGSKGLLTAIAKTFAGHALIQRCQWHKRENVVSYLAKGDQGKFRRKLQAAYEKPTYAEAFAALESIRKELLGINRSAAASLEEGLEETLTLHRLGLFEKLGTSFKTTNVIESIQARLGQYTDKVDYWKNSDQKHRWVAAALSDLEPRLRRVKGMRHLALLRERIQEVLGIENKKQINLIAA
jgi:putative transposase